MSEWPWDRIQMQIQIKQVWVAGRESVFLTNFQVMPVLLVHRPLLSSHDLMDGNCFLTHILSLISEKTITEDRDTSWACRYELLNWHFLYLKRVQGSCTAFTLQITCFSDPKILYCTCTATLLAILGFTHDSKIKLFVCFGEPWS